MAGADGYFDFNLGEPAFLEADGEVYQGKWVMSYVWHGEWTGTPCTRGGGGGTIMRETNAIGLDYPDLAGAMDFSGWEGARLIVTHDVYMVSPYGYALCAEGGISSFTAPLGYQGQILQGGSGGEPIWVVDDPPGSPPVIADDAHDPPRFSFNAWTLEPPISIPFFFYMLTGGTAPGGGHFGFHSAAGGMSVVIQRIYDPEAPLPDPPPDDPFIPVPTITHSLFPLPPCVPGGGVLGEAKQGMVLDPPRPVGRKYG